MESEISSGDRSVHEHAVISDASLVRRAQFIEEAHVDNPSAPNYESGQHLGAGSQRGLLRIAATSSSALTTLLASGRRESMSLTAPR